MRSWPAKAYGCRCRLGGDDRGEQGETVGWCPCNVDDVANQAVGWLPGEGSATEGLEQRRRALLRSPIG
jgi:hypothetical protein